MLHFISRQLLGLLLIPSLFSSTIFRREKEFHTPIRESYARKEHPTWWDGPTLFGGGATRERLAQMGVTTLSIFTTDLLGNPIGGKARGFAYAGSYGISINIDFTRAGWTGLDLFGSAVWRTGTNLSARKIDNQFTVAQVFGSQTVKLNELYLMQTLWNHRFAIKAGRLDAANDFLASPLYWKFVNNGFDGNPISIFFNVPFSVYPNATWGAYCMIQPYPILSLKLAAYNANSHINQNKYHGVNFTFKSTEGVLWITEGCLCTNGKLPGHYKAGYFFLTGNVTKFSGTSTRGNSCYYFLLDQMIYQRGPSEKEGLIPFISLVLAPKDRNLFPFFLNCGLVFQGIVPQRPDDSLNIGYLYGKYSQDLAKTEEPPQNFESIFEINYWMQLNRWVYIAPDMQYILHPKGTNTPNAWVIGAQIGIQAW